MLLAAGLILRGGYPFPDYSPMGTSPEEQVIHYLQAVLPRESRVLESLPLPAVAARMAEVSWSSAPDEISNASEFLAWLTQNRIQAVFVDSRNVPRPDLVALLESGLSSEFELGHQFPIEPDAEVPLGERSQGDALLHRLQDLDAGQVGFLQGVGLDDDAPL